MSVPVFTLKGTVSSLTGDTSTPLAGTVLTFKSNVSVGDLLSVNGASQLIAPDSVTLDSNGKINGTTGINLLANDPSFDLSIPLQWTVSAQPAQPGQRIRKWTFEAPLAGVTIDLKDVLHIVGQSASGMTKGDQGDQGDQGDPGPQGPPGPDPRRPQRNTIAAVGDSETGGGSFNNYLPSMGQVYLNQLALMTHQRIRFDGADFAISGTQIADAHDSQLPQVLAMNPLPGACILAVGTNDLRLYASPNPNFATMVATLKSMVASLLAVGVTPILWCVPPNQFATGPVAPALFQASIHQWNTYIRRYAALNGFAVIDSHAALAQADGSFLAGSSQSNLIHPNGTGQRLIAQQALADGVANIFPPNSLVHTARQTNDLSNLFNSGTTNYGLFTTDSNSDGLADGLAAVGTATKSLVAPVAADNLIGNWQQISGTAGQTGYVKFVVPTSAYSVGDVIAFSCRVQTAGMEAAGDIGNAGYELGVATDTPGGFVAPNGTTVTGLINGMFGWAVNIDDGELYVEFTVLSAMTNMYFISWLQYVTAGTAQLRVGEVTIRNLTTGGLLI